VRATLNLALGVRFDEQRRGAVRAQIVGHALSSLRVEVGDGHARALFGE